MRALAPLALALGLCAAASGRAAASPPVGVALVPDGWDWGTELTVGYGDFEAASATGATGSAAVRELGLGAGYCLGDVGPVSQLYLRLEGGYVSAAEETLEATPIGTYTFHAADRAGLVRAHASARLLDQADHHFGVWLAATAPLDLDVAKLSHARLHYAAGGVELGVALAPAVGWRAGLEVGSGAYRKGAQQNPMLGARTALELTTPEWLVPWQSGLALGLRFEADLVGHVDRQYAAAWGDELARVQGLGAWLELRPYFRLTDHAAVELGYAHRLAGRNASHTRELSVAVRGAYF
ncbi:MAG: hypothetical protein HY908_23875 [Myxococcales bacterium]|nr:hypothetical protein [Myxococcales bacterium]